jgi:hypothetical protein
MWNLGGKWVLGRLRRRWDNNTKMDLKEVLAGWEVDVCNYLRIMFSDGV